MKVSPACHDEARLLGALLVSPPPLSQNRRAEWTPGADKFPGERLHISWLRRTLLIFKLSRVRSGTLSRAMTTVDGSSSKRVKQYEIREFLGTGAMGKAYKAWDTKLNRWVTLKFLPADGKRDIFRRLEAAAQLHHRNIAAIYQIESDSDPPFVVREYVHGQPILEWTEQHERIPENILPLALQMASALQKAHRQKVIHCALHPSNILVTFNNRVKILDFGFTGEIPELKTDQVTLSLGAIHRQKNRLLSYASPEQTRGGKLDARSDIFSLGVVLYQMTTGALPFEGETPQQILYKASKIEPEPISKLNPAFPHRWQQILDRMLAKDPAKRYQSVTEFIQDASLLAKARFRKGRLRRRIAYLALLGIVLSSAGFFVWNQWLRKGLSPPQAQYVPLAHAAALEAEPHVSMDGKSVVFISAGTGNPDVWLMNRDGSGKVLVKSTPYDESWPSFSPDAKSIVFARYPANCGDPSCGALFMMTKDGLSEKKIAESANFPTWASDGRRIVFTKFGNNESPIASIAMDDPDSLIYLTDRKDGPFPHLMPAVSPDGRSVVYAAGRPSAIWIKQEGGRARPLVANKDRNQAPVWDHQGRRILYLSDRGGSFNIWSAELTSTAVFTQLTRLPVDAGRLALDPRTGVIFFEWIETTHEVHLLNPADGRDFRIASSKTRLGEISWNGLQQITYTKGNERSEIWEIDASGENPKSIMADNDSNSDGSWSPDGSLFVFISDRGGSPELWLWEKSAAQTVQLTRDGIAKQRVAWSPDGYFLAYGESRPERSQIHVLDVSGRRSWPLNTPHDAFWPAWSADGRWIYYQANAENSSAGIFRILVATGASEKMRSSGLRPSTSPFGDVVFLSTDRRHLLHLQDGSENLLSLPAGRKFLEVSYAPDGKRIGYLLERKDCDIYSFFSANFANGSRAALPSMNGRFEPVAGIAPLWKELQGNGR